MIEEANVASIENCWNNAVAVVEVLLIGVVGLETLSVSAKHHELHGMLNKQET